jgi:hypothetical protein
MTPRVVAVAAAALLYSTAASAAPILVESFDNLAGLEAAGWDVINNSSPVGTTTWFQGNSAVFGAQAGADNAYAAANLNATGDNGDISVWLITPTLTLNDGDTISFYTRTEEGSEFPDRLELRLSENGGSANVGATALSVGDFTTLLLTLNPSLGVGGYPEAWQQFSVATTGLGPITGRLAFRYFVTDGGGWGSNSNYIGLDSVAVETVSTVPVPEPSTGLLGLAGWALIALRRRSSGARARRGGVR